MASGYNTFVDNSCGADYGVNSVSDCENIYCVYDNSGNQVQNSPCSLDKASLQASYPKDQVLQNSLFTGATAGRFSYSGGHFQRFAVAANNPNPADYSYYGSSPYGFGMGSDLYSYSTETGPLLANAVLTGLSTLSTSLFTYAFPQLAGGVFANAGDYATFLQAILNNNLRINGYLGQNSVCTLPGAINPDGSTCNAAYTPIVDENMSYSYGHWVENDYSQPYSDGSFNSAGAFGFYPWIDASKTYYGVVARFVQGVTFSGQSTIGNGYQSELCGREIRYSFLTGLPVK
jgi:hypothetical protein